MTTQNKALGGLLVAQLLLAGLTWWPTGDGAPPPRDLLGFPVDSITAITVSGRVTKDEVPEPDLVLTKTGSGWVITSSEDYPATEANMAPLLESLGKLTVRAPIAVKPESQASLEVADNAHTRKLDIQANGQHRVLYLGAGQGKSSHVRVDGEVETYEVKDVSAWSINTNANRYFDRDGFVKVPLDAVTAVSIDRPGEPSLALAKGADGAWTLPDHPEMALDQAATKGFVQQLLTVRMLEPGGRARKPEYGLDGGVVVHWTADEGGSPVSHQYTVGAEIASENGRRWVASDTHEWVVKALATNLSGALTGSVDKLLDKPVDLGAGGAAELPHP